MPARDQRPLAAEEPPYKRLNTDGRLNHGSFEVAGVLDAVALAHRLYLEDRPRTLAPPEVDELRPLVRFIVTAIDTVQGRVTGRVDRMAPSSARSTLAVRCALYAYPVPWGAHPQAKQEWWHRLVDHAESLYDLALEFVDDPTAAFLRGA